ncbi:MAG TPA: ribonuclease R [Vicinamibacteria bacterium]|nr:ribonuclease R [Vicinamibacteria bacterium]
MTTRDTPTAGTPSDLGASVLELLATQGKPMGVRDIVRRLGLDAPGRHELKDVLRRLIADGQLVKIHGARVGLPDRMNLVVGRLTANPAGFGFVVPDKPAGAPRTREGDVYVSAVNMKEALHGDRVVARVERHTPKGAEGRIIRVLERAQQNIVGRFEEDGRFGGHVIPFDKRVLHEIFIPPGDEAGARPGDMVLAEITRPPTATRNPSGRVLQRLGRLEDPGTDLKVIMAKYGLPDAFPPEVDAEAERVPKTVRPADIAGRTDFRDWDTVTVDPETARDHDDAISLDRLAGGGWKLAVHIADVAHYVRPGSALDQEAYLRGTSVYFPDRVVPMLPHALSSGICSLVENQDRLTQTVVLELDAKARVRKAEFHDGVIKSRARMTYQQVQRIVDGDAELRRQFAPLVPLFERMDELAKLMRRRRYERGSLDFDLPEPKLVLDEAGQMTGIVAHARLDSMRSIEEFMLAANEAVAERLDRAGNPTLYRIHEQPDPERVEEFAELVSSFGYRLPAKLEEVRPQDFQGILRQVEGKPEEKLISYLLLRTMRLARYHEENLGHFGLATEMYAHFTSPIRRYPDLVVHRSLRAVRHGQGADVARALPAPLAEMAKHLSDMERRATDAERELIEWKKVRFMADKLGDVFSGYVTGVQSFGLFVELDEIYVQGLVHVSSMTDDYYRFDERAHMLKGENTGKVYRLGDRVKVQVAAVKLEERKIDFALVDVLERAAAGRGPGRPPTRPTRPSRPVSRGRERSPARKAGKAGKGRGGGRRRR